MLLLADENIPRLVVNKLRNQGLDIVSIGEVAAGSSDLEVIDHANKQGRIVLTADKDFGELVFHTKDKLPGVILIRLRPRSPEYLVDKLNSILKLDIKWSGHFSVIEETRIRQLLIS